MLRTTHCGQTHGHRSLTIPEGLFFLDIETLKNVKIPHFKIPSQVVVIKKYQINDVPVQDVPQCSLEKQK